jgi:hypothetical protein
VPHPCADHSSEKSSTAAREKKRTNEKRSLSAQVIYRALDISMINHCWLSHHMRIARFCPFCFPCHGVESEIYDPRFLFFSSFPPPPMFGGQISLDAIQNLTHARSIGEILGSLCSVIYTYAWNMRDLRFASLPLLSAYKGMTSHIPISGRTFKAELLGLGMAPNVIC